MKYKQLISQNKELKMIIYLYAVDALREDGEHGAACWNQPTAQIHLLCQDCFIITLKK